MKSYRIIAIDITIQFGIIRLKGGKGMEKKNKRYDVLVVEISTGKVHAVVGEDLRENEAERRLMTALARIDRENFFVPIVDAGKYKKGDIY